MKQASLILIWAALAFCAIAYFWPSKPLPVAEAIVEAKAKADAAVAVASEAEAVAVESRPKVVIAKKAAAAAKEKRIETMAKTTDSGQLASGNLNLNQDSLGLSFFHNPSEYLSEYPPDANFRLPADVFLAEIDALEELVETLEAQVELEIGRGDAWKEAAEAQQELVSAMQESHEAELKAEIKKAKRKGLKIGGIGGAAIILLLVLL
jgi:hypothetical protein